MCCASYYQLRLSRTHCLHICYFLSQRIANSKFVFYFHNQLLTPMFLSLFPANRQVQSYDTRISNCYRPHNFRTNLKQFTILYQGLKIWNSLPISITGFTSFFIFKRMMTELFNKMNPNWPSRKSIT